MFDFLADSCKQYLQDHIDNAKDSYKEFLVESSKYIANLRCSRNQLEPLFNNAKFPLDKLSEDNLIVRNKRDYQITILNDNSRECIYCINYINSKRVKNGSKWLEFHLDCGFDAEQFSSEILSIIKQYPLLKVMHDSVCSYRTEQETFDDWVDYILLCDNN